MAKGNGSDRISELHDSLLHHILSFLPTPDAAQTCVLSKRWGHVWAEVPTLKFYEGQFACRGDGALEMFPDSVNEALARRRRAPLEGLHLSCSYHRYSDDRRSHIQQWIDYSIKNKVQDLWLDFSAGPDWTDEEWRHYYETWGIDMRLPGEEIGKYLCSLPDSLLEHRPLRSLSLVSCQLKGSGLPVFEFLEKLYLSCTAFALALLEDLASRCPVLKDFGLERIFFTTLDLSLPQVKTLRLKHCVVHERFVLDAPSLRCFEYHGDPLENLGRFSITRSEGLAQCQMKIFLRHRVVEEIQSSKLRKFMANFGHVETLNLSCSFIEDMIISKDLKGVSAFPPLHKLKKMELQGSAGSNSIFAILSLLSASPNLEVLHINLRSRRLMSEPPEAVPIKIKEGDIQYLQNAFIECLQDHVLEIKLNECEEKEFLIKLSELLLKKAKVLKVMSICTSKDFPIRLAKLKAILKRLQLSSPTANILLS